MAIQTLRIETQTLWEVDPAKTSVEYTVKQLGFIPSKGRFTDVHGRAVTEGDGTDGAAIEVEIDAASIQTGIGKRDEHLRSSDFLDVERYPTITFRSTAVVSRGQDKLGVYGDLTVHGVTRQVCLDATIQERDEEQATLTASTSFERRDFGVGLKANPVMVGKTVDVRINLALKAL